MSGKVFHSFLALLAGLIVVFGMLGHSPMASAASFPTKVVFAYATLLPRVAVPLWIAQERGLFHKNGINADLVFVRSAPVLMGGLAAGDIHMGSTGGNPALAAASGGLDSKIVANFASRAAADLVVRPDIRSPEDLRGKRVGVQSIGGTTWLYAMLGLERVGLDPARDRVRILVIGEQTIIGQALEAGMIDAAIFSARNISRQLKEKGFPILAEFNMPVAGGSVIVRQSYLQQRSDTVTNVLKALLEGAAISLNPKNKPFILEMIMKRLRTSDPIFAEEGYKDLVEQVDRRPYPSIEGLRNIQRLMKVHNPRLGLVNVEDIIDSSLIRNLDESGFIDKLYGVYDKNRQK